MTKTEPIYGALPTNLGPVNLDCSEMLYWLYCPVRLPSTGVWGCNAGFVVPPNLKQFMPLLRFAETYVSVMDENRWDNSFVYVTAKTMWCDGRTANRPGWHSDGFLTDDLNFIWQDRAPTIFCHDAERVAFTSDHLLSLKEMEEWAEARPQNHVTYPLKHLLLLDQSVIHKVDDKMAPGIRTFVKISVSRHPYALRGNSINHELPLDVAYAERLEERNCPARTG